MTHSRSGPAAVNLRLTRSSERASSGLRTVVRILRAGATPVIAASRINRSTRLRKTAWPSRCSTAWMRGLPYAPSESAWIRLMSASNCASRTLRAHGLAAAARSADTP